MSIQLLLQQRQEMPHEFFAECIADIKRIAGLRGGRFKTDLKTGRSGWYGYCKKGKFPQIQMLCENFLGGGWIVAIPKYKSLGY